jgi:hypothetical protein
VTEESLCTSSFSAKVVYAQDHNVSDRLYDRCNAGVPHIQLLVSNFFSPPPAQNLHCHLVRKVVAFLRLKLKRITFRDFHIS